METYGIDTSATADALASSRGSHHHVDWRQCLSVYCPVVDPLFPTSRATTFNCIHPAALARPAAPGHEGDPLRSAAASVILPPRGLDHGRPRR